jgi:hypothetical protein
MNPEKDMAICFVLFNPTHSKRLLMNALYVKNLLESEGYPIFTLELVYEGRDPELPYAFHVSGSSILFHKENLYTILEPKIPPCYTKLAFLDADVYFSDKEWYIKTSELLNTYDVVQPFEECVWLDLTYQKELLRRKTIVLGNTNYYSEEYHPGFAWCMRRDWYKEYGFFEYALCGNGDTLSTAAWFQKKFQYSLTMVPICNKMLYEEYYKKAKPRMAYSKGTILYHLFHGSREKRKYFYRDKLLQTHSTPETLVEKNKDGVFEWIDKSTWNPIFLEYFQQREDDGI